MKCLRLVFVGFLLVICVFLTGFKKSLSNRDTSTKSQHSAGEDKLQKPLDLRVPQRDVSFEKSPESLTIVQDTSLDNLSYAKKARALELNGHLIMSQEPEAGKIKSADGAGILINLRH